jgi:hypothetical protein
MSRALWLNAALLAAVAALSAFIYFKPAHDEPAEYPLSALESGAVKSVRIERAGAAPVLLEKRQGAWFITAPLAARADDSRVQRLLAITDARASHRLPDTNLSRFDLERPQVRVILDGEPFSFGMVSAVAREQYVLAGNYVYTVHPRYGMALPANASDVASPQLFGPGEMPVRMALRQFTVEQRDGKWTLHPGARDLSQDDLLRWVDEWRLASALRVEPRSAARSQVEIEVQLKNAGRFTLGVLSREPELVIARSDEKLQYHFRADLAKRLLSPPGTDQQKKP